MIEKDEKMKKFVIEKVLEEIENNATTLDIMRSVIGKDATLLDFKKPDPYDMLDVEESEKIESDANLFKKYDFGIENSLAVGSVLSESTDFYENAIKFEFKGKEASVGFSELIDYYSENKESYCDVTFLMNISSKDRLHITTIDELYIDNYERIFDNCFKNYEEVLDKYDTENALRYAEYFSDRIPEIKEEKYSFKYKLNNLEKEFLSQVYNVYRFPFTLSFKFGVMCISSRFKRYDNYERYIEEIVCFIKCMLRIIEEFMN